MSKEIRKQARITEVRDDILVLEMCVQEACGACAAKGLCGQDPGSRDRKIELANDGLPRSVGDQVTLVISSSIGIKGAFFAYFLPVVAVLSGLIAMQQSGLNDFVSGISALGILALYFVVLWIFRDKIEKNILITIE